MATGALSEPEDCRPKLVCVRIEPEDCRTEEAENERATTKVVIGGTTGLAIWGRGVHERREHGGRV